MNNFNKQRRLKHMLSLICISLIRIYSDSFQLSKLMTSFCSQLFALNSFKNFQLNKSSLTSVIKINNGCKNKFYHLSFKKLNQPNMKFKKNLNQKFNSEQFRWILHLSFLATVLGNAIPTTPLPPTSAEHPTTATTAKPSITCQKPIPTAELPQGTESRPAVMEYKVKVKEDILTYRMILYLTEKTFWTQVDESKENVCATPTTSPLPISTKQYNKVCYIYQLLKLKPIPFTELPRGTRFQPPVWEYKVEDGGVMVTYRKVHVESGVSFWTKVENTEENVCETSAQTVPTTPTPIQDPLPNDFQLPWLHCRLVLNEFNTNTANLNADQFVELLQICKAGKYAKIDDLTRFWILVTKGDSQEIVLSKSLENLSLRESGTKRKKIKVFTIGGETVAKVDLKIEDCPMAGGGTFLPIGEDSPYSIILLYGDVKELAALNLKTNDQNQFLPLHITPELLTLIKKYLQDILVYGSKTSTQKCSIFENIYPPFADPQQNYLLQDWLTNPHANDMSLNRCGKEFLPVLPRAWAYAKPTPGEINDCEHSFAFNWIDHIPEISNILEAANIVDPENKPACHSSTFSEQSFQQVQPESYEEAFRAAEMDASFSHDPDAAADDNLEMEIDRVEDAIEAAGVLPHAPKYKCTDENPYNMHPEWKEKIQQHQKEILDIQTIESCEVKPWFHYYYNEQNPEKSTYGCKFCSDLVASGFASVRPGRITDIMKPGGTLVSEGNEIMKRNKLKQLRHPKDAYHKIATHYVKEKDWYESVEELHTALKQPDSLVRKYYRATEDVIATVYKAVKNNLSFEQYANNVQFVKSYFNANLGVHYHDGQSMEKIVDMLSTEMHKRLLDHLLSETPEISVILDTSDDIQGKHYLAVLFQTFDRRTRPKIFFYRLLKIGVSETAESLFNLFWDAIKEDGLQDYLKQKLRGYSSDGASVVKSAFLKLLKKNTNNFVLGNHCAAHRLDLVTSHAFKAFPFLLHLDEVVNEQYNYLHGRSLKIRAKLEQVTISEEDYFFTLHRLFPIRWIASKFNAIKIIINHWLTIVTTYDSIKDDKEFTASQRAKAVDLRTELTKRPVVSTFGFVEDLCMLFQEFSKNFQIEAGTPIPVKQYKKVMHEQLNNLKLNFGSTEAGIFSQVECTVEGKKVQPCPLEVFEDESTDVKYLGQELTYVKNEDYPPLSTSRADYINALHGQLLAYFPDDIFDSFSIFYPKTMPTPDQPWNDFGKKELEALSDVFGWTWLKEQVYEDWERLVTSIVTNREQFLRKKELNLEDFWYFYYNDALKIEWTPITKEIVRIMLIIPGSSATAERIFSFVTIIKTARRSLLKPENLEALIRIKFNGPEDVREIDLFAYAKEWCKTHATADDITRMSYTPDDYTTNFQPKYVGDLPSTLF